MTQLAGKSSIVETEKIIKVIETLKEKGAEAILIACTDLPLIIKQEDTHVPLVNCTVVYANETARFASIG